MARTHQRGQIALPLRPGERSRLANLIYDPEYLSLKDRLGEPLSAEDRARLDAWQSRAQADCGGGA